jgi:hypothetical protein
MNPDENKKALRLLVSLFSGSTITQEQGSLIRDEFSALSFGAVVEAIKEHRRTHEHVILNQLFEGCRAAERGATTKATVASAGEGTWFDVRRRQNRQFEGRHDVEVALRVYRGWWVKSPQTKIWRRKLLSQCTTQLLGAAPLTEGGEHLDHAGAEEWALTIFGDVPFFKQCLEQIRDTVPLPFMPEGVPSSPASLAS